MATGWGKRVRVEMQKVPTNQTATAQTTPFAGLSTANPADDGQSNAEPTSTGGYARQAITFSTLVAYTSLTNDAASNALNSAAFSFGNGSPTSGGSTAAYSTGATALTYISLWTSSTLTTEAAYLGRALIATPQTVNAAGITLTVAISGLTMGCISA